MSGLFVSLHPFLFQVWPDLEWKQDSADRPGELLRPLTRSCFLLLLGSLFLHALPFLLGICLRSRWSPPFPLHAPALILPLSCQGAALAHLDSLPLMIWYSGQTALFLLARAAPGFFPTALSLALRPVFPFWQAKYAPSFSAEVCAILHALCRSRQHQQVCHFSFLTIWLSFCSPLRFSSYLKLCGRSGRNCLLSPPVLSGYNGSPDTRFSRKTTRLMSWPDGERYLRPPQSPVASLISRIHFSWTKGVQSHLNSLTHRFLRFPPRNLCSLVMLAVSSLVFAATDTAFC